MHMYVNIRLVKRRFLSEEKELIEKRINEEIGVSKT
jgi:hypothetical protein